MRKKLSPPDPPPEAHTADARTATLEIINAEITAALARASDASSRIDNKAIVIVGYAGAAATFLATRHPQPILAALAYTAYATAAALGTWAYAVQTYTDVPRPDALFTTYLDKTPGETLTALAATRAQAFRANTKARHRKRQRWWASLLSLTAGIILMIAALTISHNHNHGSHTTRPRQPAATRQS